MPVVLSTLRGWATVLTTQGQSAAAQCVRDAADDLEAARAAPREALATFNSCVRGLVSEEYAEGYQEACEHLALDIATGNPRPETQTVGVIRHDNCRTLTVPTGSLASLGGTLKRAITGQLRPDDAANLSVLLEALKEEP